MDDNSKSLLVKSAMTYGLALGIYWGIKYIFFVLSVSNMAFNLVYWALTMAVPFIAWFLTKKYRDEQLGGQISFFHAWRFGTMLYFFAALIVSLVHFVYFQYIASPDFMAKTFSQLISLLKESQLDTHIVESVSKMAIPSPIHMAIQGIFNNIFYGIVLSIPVAALLCRNNKTGNVSEPTLKDNE